MAGAAETKGGALKRDANFEDPDGFYAAYIAAHAGLSERSSELLNARLVLILANQIGTREVLLDALDLARSTLPADAPASALRPDSP